MKVMASAAQYTVRNVPASVDRALRRLAKQRNQSLNALLLEVLRTAAGEPEGARQHDDLDHLIGTWQRDPETDRALSEQRRVVPGDWP
jgi:plasmid stability protein